MKKLVIYFSRTGENYMRDGIRNIDKGNTEIVAEKIAIKTGAELFKVETVKDYPYDYHECCNVAKKEWQDQLTPELKRYLTDISDYDTIYIGYPIWFGTFPMALKSFLERLDFTGKIVKSFATNEGSGLANSVRDLKNICRNATVLDGLSIRGSDASNSDVLLDNWI